MANNIVDNNYAQFVEIPAEEPSEMHKPFSESELSALWEHAENPNVQVVLILCYTGMRPSELIQLKRENVYLAKRYMVGGIKTKAGKNRVIPINKKILPFISRIYNGNQSEQLVMLDGKAVTYDVLRKNIFADAMKEAGITGHLAHDGRHTCATLLNNANVNEKCIKLILGHASTDVTEKVYTHKTIEQLIDAIDAI